MKKLKNDIILICVLLIIALAGYIIVNLFVYKTGNIVEIYYDSNLIKTVSLLENTEFEVTMNNHTNIVKIENGSVYIKEADCPDKLCKKQGKISKSGQSIICLPNKVVIRISSSKDNDVDAKSK